MRRLESVLGYIAASLVLAALPLTPFVLMPRFSSLVGGLGIPVHPKFTGGPVVRTLERGTYQVAVSAPAGSVGPLEEQQRFVQVSWSPLSALPDHVEEELDLDADGHPDLGIAFFVPKDPSTPLRGQVNVLDSTKVVATFLKQGDLGRRGDLSDLSAILVRLDDRIVARLPVK